MPNVNKIKGDLYEIHIKNYILSPQYNDHKNIINCWLWKDIPQTHLYTSKIINTFNENRLNRKNKINPLKDIGLDILCVNKNGEYIMVQCKNYTNTVPMSDLSGFFIYMAKHIEKLGLIYYTSRISNNIREILGHDDRIQLIKKTMANSGKKENGKKINFKLYDYQKEIFDKGIEFYKKEKSGYITVPCGVGKTAISYYIAQQLSSFIIFIVPLKQHCEQVIDRINEYSNNAYKCVIVDSDGTRDIKEIKNIIKENNKIFITATYKSCDIVNRIMKECNNIDPFVIIDEFHNLSYKNIYGYDEKIHKKLLRKNDNSCGEVDENEEDENEEDENEDKDDNNEEDDDKEDENEENIEKDDIYEIINNDKYKKLFLSATPRFYELENNNDIETESIIGNCIYKMDFKYAIEKGLITDYRIIIPSNIKDDTHQIKEIEKEIDIIQDYEMSKKLCFLYEGIKMYGSIKCIIYCRDSDEMKRMMKLLDKLNEYFGYEYHSNYITCEVSKKERAKRIKEFREYDGISLLFSVDILNECIDIPECDSIYITYNSKSKIQTIQRMCRAMRIDKNNRFKMANIFVWSYEDINDCVDILSAIKEADADVTKKITFTECNNKLKTVKQLEEESIKKLDGCKKFLVSIQEYRAEKWHDMLDQVKAFIDQHKKKPSDESKDNNEKKLSRWLSSQIMKYRKNIYVMKNNLEIKNSWKKFVEDEKYKNFFIPAEEKWDNTLKEIEKFVNENKSRPNEHSLNINEKRLARWISNQTKNYKKCINIMKNKIIREKWILFIENENYRNIFLSDEEIWLQNLEKLKKFIDTNKIRPNQKSHNVNEKNLSSWTVRQVINYKKRSQIMKFTNIREKWKNFIENEKYKNLFISNENEWLLTLNKVKIFIDNNKFRPKQNSNNNSEKILGMWISNQQKNYKNNCKIMKDQYIKDLWKSFIKDKKYENYFLSDEENWDTKLKLTKQFIDNNNCKPNPKSQDENEKILAYWISHQIRNYENNRQIMQNQTIRDKWIKFIDDNKYKKLFVQKEKLKGKTILVKGKIKK